MGGVTENEPPECIQGHPRHDQGVSGPPRPSSSARSLSDRTPRLAPRLAPLRGAQSRLELTPLHTHASLKLTNSPSLSG